MALRGSVPTWQSSSVAMGACGGNLYMTAYNKKELDKKELRIIYSQGPITKGLFPLVKPHRLEDLQPSEMAPPAGDQVLDMSL